MEAAPLIAVASLVGSAVYTKKSIDTQKKQIKNARAAAQKEYELEREQTNLVLEEQQRKNRNLLARQQSAYKAKLGAGGMSSKSGSGQTILDTMQKEHDIEDKYLVDRANISLESLLNGINESNTRNLLALNNASNKQMSNLFNTTGSITNLGSRNIIK